MGVGQDGCRIKELGSPEGLDYKFDNYPQAPLDFLLEVTKELQWSLWVSTCSGSHTQQALVAGRRLKEPVFSRSAVLGGGFGRSVQALRLLGSEGLAKISPKP